VGKNATGIATSPIDSEKLVHFSEEAPVPPGGTHDIEEAREQFSAETGVVGSVPPPGSLKGMAKVALDALKGKKASVFIDRLSERAAFERTGTRLYEAMIAKYDALGGIDGGPTRERLVEIRDEEIEHLGILREAIEGLGGDPTVMTPSADLVGVEGTGLVQVLTDPRTTVEECLGALLVAELVDNDGWSLLARLADGMGHDQLAETFREALADELMHLEDVRRWVSASVSESSQAEVPVAEAAPPPP
jgi:rubrerythrin